MIKRREFVAAAGAIVAAHALPELSFAQATPAVPNDAAANAALVPPPRGGLRANYNYYMYSEGKPITDLSVEVDFAEDFISEGGFSIQLNGWAPTNAHSTWQQYCYGFYTANKAKPHLSWSIENWPSNDYREQLHRTVGLPIPSDLFNLHGQNVTVPDGIKIPKGYKFKITLLHDPNDARGAIIGAAYSVIDNHGKTIIDDRPLIRSYEFSHTKALIEQAALDPIITVQINICKRAGSNYGFMESGAGTITYASTQPLTALSARPDGLAAPGIITAEWANTVYGELPVGPAHRFTQTFDTIKAPGFQAGAPFVVSRRFGADQTDLFAVSVSGKLEVFSVSGAGHWQRSDGYGPVDMAHPATAIAASERFGAGNQTGVFLVAQNGQLQAFWIGPNGVDGPIPTGSTKFAHPGAAITAARQFGTHDQTDVFLLDQKGQLYVFWAFATGGLNGPNKIGPAGVVPDHAQLTAFQRPGTRQTYLFMIDKSGALTSFRVEGGGHWEGPDTISAADFARPGGHVAAAQRSPNGDGMDVFVVDKHGQLQAFAREKEGSWSGPVAIGPRDLANSGTPIAVSHRSERGQADVFVVDKNGTLTAFVPNAGGHWGSPELIGSPGAAPGGACVMASPQFGVENRTGVFVINHLGGGVAGWPEVTWADEKSAWSASKKLAREV